MPGETGSGIGHGALRPGASPCKAGEVVPDLVAEAIQRRVLRDLELSADAGRQTRRNPQYDRRVAEPIGIVAPVCQQNPRLRDRGRHRPRAGAVQGLASRKEYPDRSSLCVGRDMLFRVPAAFRPTGQPSAPPFFAARLKAVRCSFGCPRQWFSGQWRTVGLTSIITIPVSCACAASSVMIVANTPIRLHRFQRVQGVLGGPQAAGAFGPALDPKAGSALIPHQPSALNED
jgi:hypothetical protein